jgi:hypothetical protein
VFRDVTADFVDREKELALFHQMLEGSVGKQLLLISERGEQGKSYFLHRLAYECEQQSPPVPAVYLDFDQRKSGLTDYLSVARAARRQLGDTNTPAVCACEKAICRPAPLVNIQTGTGSGSGVDLGKKTKLESAKLSEVAGRDNISVGDVSGGAPTSADLAAQRAAMGRALCSDLGQLSETHPRAVVLIDTFEHVSDETCGWLESWLFERLHDDLPHVLLVVAGRPEKCREFFTPAHVWSRVITYICFESIGDDDILAHYEKRGLTISASETTLFQIARTNPAKMALVGDLLEQTQGGAR